MNFKIGDRVKVNNTTGVIVGFLQNYPELALIRHKGSGHDGSNNGNLTDHLGNVIGDSKQPTRDHYYFRVAELKLCKESNVIKLLNRIDDLQELP